MKRVSKSENKKRSDLKKASSIRLPKDYPWKVLNSLMNDLRQYLTEDDGQLLDAIIRNRDFAAYRILSEDWGLLCMVPTGVPLETIRARYLLASLLKKFCFPSDALERQEAAMKKFVTAEILCRQYNHSGYKKLRNGQDPFTVRVIDEARKWIEKVLGYELPEVSVLTDKSRHGPGASSSTRKGQTSAYFKYADWPYDCTRRASGYAVELIKNDERWLGALEDSYRERNDIPKHLILDQESFFANVLNYVEGNKIAFVPKSAETDRTIAIEPTLNLNLQLGVDGFIRSRLKRWSIDLDDQSKNRELARQGSITSGSNSLVTLDLSMASDTISTRIVMELLPPEWCDYLMDIRSPKGVLNEILFPYEKISSMGNGFTFALESLIFASIVYGVGKVRLGTFDFSASAIFGDDLIVTSDIAEDVVHILKVAGFRINHDKSFFEGPVRESCGADWFMGMPVRPVHLTSMPLEIKELFNDYNRLRRHLDLRFGIKGTTCVSKLIHSYIPNKFKNLKGPCSDDEFDTYLHADYVHVWPYRANVNNRYKHGTWKFKRLVRRPVLHRGKRVGSLPFRKLMHSLHPAPQVFNKWEKVKSGGSTFEVPDGNTWFLALTSSETEIWSSEYAEQPIERSPAHIPWGSLYERCFKDVWAKFSWLAQ